MKYLIYLIILTFLGLNIYLFIDSFYTKEIAFVDTIRVVKEYEGTRIVQKELDSKFSDEKAILSELNKRILDLQNKESSLNNEDTELLKKLKKAFQVQRQAYQEKIAERQDILMSGTINQINSYVKKYAIQNNIKLVLGSNYTGNIIYGNESIEITDEVIKYLNHNYSKSNAE
ncbi:hypothetical protein MATR_21310 [Marivirga tractuosa]|uniref:Outer membrane chaperone Skp (OmpH) n=1 Tax=Marivirga tractuosa (strain ATCC 23168 / DSM 4126 / NBRC 15989 / NCIMB 1408 / VKM B-1430 / H-43) TaxID=643867 RepID=E4TLB5_MARTH|nr:OmpH family outer membrane protein [Marivirga tractuosa]ADR20253.1 outer membrane chaperone Skp (OmpH) [Marivirga tractuosa DSM 4126]BDD15306.1 hypothetical protein MATR_21310 [Marivirga tractuosa]